MSSFKAYLWISREFAVATIQPFAGITSSSPTCGTKIQLHPCTMSHQIASSINLTCKWRVSGRASAFVADDPCHRIRTVTSCMAVTCPCQRVHGSLWPGACLALPFSTGSAGSQSISSASSGKSPVTCIRCLGGSGVIPMYCCSRSCRSACLRSTMMQAK